MATLMPRAGGRYLSPLEVITRVQAEFVYVETTEEGARIQVIEWMSQLAFVTAGGRAAAVDNYLDQLERFQDAACFVHCGDDLGSNGVLLSMLMIPHQPLIIEAHAQDVETWALIYRCAAALDYEIIEEGTTAGDAGSDSTYATARAAV